MNRAAAVLFTLASLTAAPRAHAQISVEVRGGAAIGSYEPTTAGLQTGARPAFGGRLGYSVLPNLELFAGYSVASFRCDEGFCEGGTPTFTAYGPEAGVRVQLPARLWVRAGVTKPLIDTQLHFPDDSGPTAYEYERTRVGTKVGAGFALPLGRRVSISPGVEYTRFSAHYSGGENNTMALLTGDLGLRIRF